MERGDQEELVECGAFYYSHRGPVDVQWSLTAGPSSTHLPDSLKYQPTNSHSTGGIHWNQTNAHLNVTMMCFICKISYKQYQSY